MFPRAGLDIMGWNKSMGNYGCSFLGYEAGNFGRVLSAFRRNLLLLSSILKMLIKMYQATRGHIPDIIEKSTI
jgi:hypothetical protein